MFPTSFRSHGRVHVILFQILRLPPRKWILDLERMKGCLDITVKRVGTAIPRHHCTNCSSKGVQSGIEAREMRSDSDASNMFRQRSHGFISERRHCTKYYQFHHLRSLTAGSPTCHHTRLISRVYGYERMEHLIQSSSCSYRCCALYLSVHVQPLLSP